MRAFWLGLIVVLGGYPWNAMAVRPDGLDCDRHQEIPAERCAKWKERNADGKWWCRWNLESGALEGVFGWRGQPISPGLDLTRITRESARDSAATRALLEAYGRQQIRDHEILFGFRLQGNDLRLTDFHRRPAGTRRTVRPDGSVLEEAMVAVSTIHFVQIVRQLPLHGGEIELQVDDENRLVSLFSTFDPDVPNQLDEHEVSEQAAITAARGAVGARGGSGRQGAERVFTRTRDGVIPVFLVSLSLDAPGVDALVIVDGRTAAVLHVSDTSDSFEGYEKRLSGRVFSQHPPFEDPAFNFDSVPITLDPDGADASEFMAGLEDVQLLHVRQAVPTRLDGYFAIVANQEQESWSSDLGPLIPPRDEWTMLVDENPDDEGDGCRPTDADPNGTHADREPDTVSPTNRTFESRFDEMSAYFHVTNAADHFYTRYGYQMNRSAEANPKILTLVNARFKEETLSGTNRLRAHFRTGCVEVYSLFEGERTACLPHLLFTGTPCWNHLFRGNDSKFVRENSLDVLTVDYYSLPDWSREESVAWHEFTHAINWDIVRIHNDAISCEEAEDAPGDLPCEEFPRAGSAFKEAIADFFPASALGRSLFGSWPSGDGGRQLDPVEELPDGSVVELDQTWPYTQVDPPREGDQYDNGRVWSHFLWDLRTRAALIENELGGAAINAHSVEDLQFEALFRMPRTIKGWQTALTRLIDADEGLTGSQLSYEIVASAARHGLKLTRGLAAVVPDHYVIERGSGLQQPRFTIYSGANDSCRILLSRDPRFPQEGDETLSLSCLAPTCIRSRIPSANDDENLRFRCSLSSGVMGQLAPDPDVVTSIFYKVQTDGPEGEQWSVISGGGNTIFHPDVPAFFIVPESGGGGGCLPVCGVAWSRRGPGVGGTLPGAAALLAFLFRRRRA